MEKNLCAQKRILTVFGVPFVDLFLIGIGAAFAGWLTENVFHLFFSGMIDSRFHLLPFLSPYALIPLAMHILMGDANDLKIFGRRVFKQKSRKSAFLSNVLCLGLILLTIFLGELAVGNLWEALFGVKLWDYSGRVGHITQYACLVSVLGNGIGAYLLFRFAYAPTLRFVQANVPHRVALAICATLGTAIVLDTAVMILRTAVTGAAPTYWALRIF